MIKANGVNIQFNLDDKRLSPKLFRKDIDIELKQKQIVLLYGPSGSGKTTIFQILSHLIEFSSGEIYWDRYKVEDLNRSNKQRYKHISMIYSVFNFIETLSVKDNILLPSLFAKERGSEILLDELIELFYFGKESNINLADLLKKGISNLSNGQKEIVAISRALLMQKPKFVFADEMLRSFNKELEDQVWAKILQFLSKYNRSLFMITHKEHLGDNLHKNVSLYCGDDYDARILTIEDQILVEKTHRS